MSDYLKDLENSDQSTVEIGGPAYPYLQWVNGKPDRKPLGGIAYTGGWFIPADNAPQEMPRPWLAYELTHSTGDSTAGWASRDVTVAIIRSRFCWFYKAADGSTVRAARSEFDRNLNMRGHLQVLVGVHGLAEPYVLTLKGTASKSFEEQQQLFDRYILGPANAGLAGKKTPDGKPIRAPRYAFWLALGPQRDEKKQPVFSKVGQGNDTSMVTLMLSDAGSKALPPDELAKRFVGPELRVQFQAWYHEAAEWTAAWGKANSARSAHWYADPVWRDKFDALALELHLTPQDVAEALAAPTPFQWEGSYDMACLALRELAIYRANGEMEPEEEAEAAG